MKWISLAFIIILAGCVSNQKQSEKAALHLQLAIGLMQQQNYPVALQELLVAQDLDNRNADIQAYLGTIYFIRERLDLAEKHFKKAVELNPRFSDAKNNLARVYAETMRLNEAEKLLKEILEDYTYPDFARAYFNYGLVEFHRKNYKLALNYFGRTLQQDRENCLAHVYVGRSYLELGQNNFAVDELNKAISFCQPLQVDDGHYFNAIALYRNNQKDLAVIRFQELLKIYPAGKNRENTKKMLDVLKKGKL